MAVNELLIDIDDPNGTVPFPAVSVCNVNPFTSNASVYKEHGIPLPTEYHKKVLELTSCMDCTIGEHITMETLRASLLTFRGYYEYVGKEGMAKIGHKNLVVQCVVFVVRTSSRIELPCEKFSRHYTYIDPDHGLCYAYNAVSTKKNMVLGFSFILYLDSSFDNINTEFESMSLFNQNAGAKIFTYDPHSLPLGIGTFTLVDPGKTSLSKISVTRVDRLSTPYSVKECVDTKSTDFKTVNLGNQVFSLSHWSCIGTCILEYIADQCHCIDINVIQNPEIDHKFQKYGYCNSINQPKEELFKKVDCSERLKSIGNIYCSQKCKEPCKEIKYDLFSSSTRWPLPSQTGTFYTRFIKNKSFEHQFSHKEDIYKRIAAGDKSVSESERFYALRIIEDNFASVVVYMSSMYYTHLKDEAKLGIAALFSQLGGSLNLWSGITVLVFVEIIDFIIRLRDGSKTENAVPSVKRASRVDIDLHGNQVHKFSQSPSPSNSVEL